MEQPTILTLEITQTFVDNEENRGPDPMVNSLIKNNAAEQIVSYFRELDLMWNYEYKISKEYAQEKGIQLHLIDDAVSDIHRSEQRIALKRNLEEMISEFEKMIPMLNLFPKIIEDLRKKNVSKTDSLYKIIKFAFGRQYEQLYSKSILEPSRHVFGKRDETMAKKLKEFAAENKDAKIVHIGGMAHLLDDEKGETLYSRLKEEFNPTRVALLDYD